MAEGLAEAGAALVLNGSDAQRLSAAATALRAAGHAVAEACFDVTDEAAVVAAFERLDAEGVAVDILVNAPVTATLPFEQAVGAFELASDRSPSMKVQLAF